MSTSLYKTMEIIFVVPECGSTVLRVYLMYLALTPAFAYRIVKDTDIYSADLYAHTRSRIPDHIDPFLSHHTDGSCSAHGCRLGDDCVHSQQTAVGEELVHTGCGDVVGIL